MSKKISEVLNSEVLNMYPWSWHPLHEDIYLGDKPNRICFYEIKLALDEEKIQFLRSEKYCPATPFLVGKIISFPTGVSYRELPTVFSKMRDIRPANLHEFQSFISAFLNLPNEDRGKYRIAACGTDGFVGTFNVGEHSNPMFHIGMDNVYFYPAGTMFLMMYK